MRNGGFSLNEALIALLIVGVVAGLAAPAFQPFVARQGFRADVHTLIVAVQLARHSAAAYRSTVTLCAADPDSSERDGCGGDWRSGVLVFIDRDGNGRREREERVLATFPALRYLTSVRWRAFGRRRHLQFDALGRSYAQNGAFELCGRGDGNRARVVLNAAGRLRTQWQEDGDTLENSRGVPLRCR